MLHSYILSLSGISHLVKFQTVRNPGETEHAQESENEASICLAIVAGTEYEHTHPDRRYK